MKRFHHHTFLLVLAITVTLLVVAVYGYMYYVVRVSIVRAATARDIVALEKANKERENDVRSLYERTKEARASLSDFFIPADRVVEFIESIEALGPQTGSEVSLRSIEDLAPGKIEGKAYGLAKAEVEAIGSWTSVMRALSLAENFPYMVSITNTRLDTSIGTTGSRKWKAKFTIEVVLSDPLSSSVIH